MVRKNMSESILKRQIITDSEGNPIGVILPMDEYLMIEQNLPKIGPHSDVNEKLKRLHRAIEDPLFMTDLEESMVSFTSVDDEWWEHES